MLAVLVIPLSVFGQQRITFEQLQRKYGGQAGYTTIEVTEAMLKLIGASKSNDKSKNMLSGMSGIRNIRIITADRETDSFTDDMKRMVGPESGYKLLTSVEENGQTAQFYYKDVLEEGSRNKTPRVAEFVMILYGGADNLVMNILGDFSITQITSIADQAASGESFDLNF